MRRRPPRSTRPDTLFPYTTLFRSVLLLDQERHQLAPIARAPAISPWMIFGRKRRERATPKMVTATAFRIVSAMIFPFVSAPVGAHGDEVDAGEAAPVDGVGGAGFEARAREARTEESRGGNRCVRTCQPWGGT